MSKTPAIDAFRARIEAIRLSDPKARPPEWLPVTPQEMRMIDSECRDAMRDVAIPCIPAALQKLLGAELRLV